MRAAGGLKAGGTLLLLIRSLSGIPVAYPLSFWYYPKRSMMICEEITLRKMLRGYTVA